jgi:hypothetical protein
MFAGHRTFDVDAPFVARCGFTFDNVEYKTGAPFPARDLGLELPKIWELWSQYIIDNAAPAAAQPIVPPPSAQPKQQGRAARR